MDDKLTISLTIAGIRLSFPIKKDKEQIYRDAAKMINSRIIEYKGRYAGIDPINFLAVVAMENTVKLLEVEQQNDIKPILAEIEKLTRQIDKYVKE